MRVSEGMARPSAPTSWPEALRALLNVIMNSMWAFSSSGFQFMTPQSPFPRGACIISM
jgi:hypothetical protein